MPNKFKTLTAEVVRNSESYELLISGINLPRSILDIRKLTVSNKGTPVIGNYELEIPVVLDDGSITSFCVTGIAFFPKKVLADIEKAEEKVVSMEKVAELITQLQALKLDTKTIKQILEQI